MIVNEETALKICNNLYKTIDDIKKSIHDPNIKNLFEPLYNYEFEKFKKAQEKNEKYPDYFDFENITWRIKITKENINNNINILINYKYQIISPYISHKIELFNVNSNDFFHTMIILEIL